MNKFLASSVGYLNGVIAVVIIFTSGFGMRNMALRMGGTLEAANGALIFGLLVGLVLAVLVCGVLALFVEIRREVVAIREALSKEHAKPG
jgi:hypothetical protein